MKNNQHSLYQLQIEEINDARQGNLGQILALNVYDSTDTRNITQTLTGSAADVAKWIKKDVAKRNRDESSLENLIDQDVIVLHPLGVESYLQRSGSLTITSTVPKNQRKTALKQLFTSNTENKTNTYEENSVSPNRILSNEQSSTPKKVKNKEEITYILHGQATSTRNKEGPGRIRSNPQIVVSIENAGKYETESCVMQPKKAIAFIESHYAAKSGKSKPIKQIIEEGKVSSNLNYAPIAPQMRDSQRILKTRGDPANGNVYYKLDLEKILKNIVGQKNTTYNILNSNKGVLDTSIY